MAFSVTITLLVLITTSTVNCNCPSDHIHSIGHCSLRFQCFETITGIELEKECYGSSNYDVEFDVFLRNATDTFHLQADPDFLPKITTLTVQGNWPVTNLSFLDSMYKLKNINLANSNMQTINGSPFHNLFILETINLSHNKISIIDDLFQFDLRPSKLYKLSLAYNTIEIVPAIAFEELTSLLELDLSNNLITNLIDQPFNNLTNLETLRLDNNLIIDLDGAVNNFNNLQHLHLRFNHIEYIDEVSLNTIYHLKTFDIANNNIKILKPRMLWRHLDHLSNHSIFKIIISGNYINYIPDAMFELYGNSKSNGSKNLIQAETELYLSNNEITDIEFNAFQAIIKLTSLDLSNNKLMIFTVNPEDLIYLKYLNLSCNYLRNLHYESFSLMYNLHNLDLSHNAIDYFPDQSLSNSFELKYINVTYNDISELNHLRITFHHSGGVLDLSNNRIAALHIPEHEAIGLTQLILMSNNITDAYLIRLIDQRDLITIDMSKNFIRELDESSLQLPMTLGYLDLRFNEIQRIGPSAFHRVSNLKTLRLSHNYLETIEYGAFLGLTSLVNLDLSYNKIKFLDSKVFMNLRQLTILSLRNNGLNFFELDGWLYHKIDLKVYIDGNDLSCEWLAKALKDHSNGYSKMYPAVFEPSLSDHSIEGIPCKQEIQNIIRPSQQVLDERLLIVCQKILEAVEEQSSILKKYIWRSILKDAERKT